MELFSYSRSYRGPLKAVVFDWAGTTIDYGCYAPAIVFIEVFRRYGVEISMEEAREPMGTHKQVHIRLISQIPRVARAWREAHGRECTEEDVQAMFEAFVPLQLDCLADYAALIPGTNETVAECRRRGMKIGATTGYDKSMMDIVAAEAKKQGYEPDSSVCVIDVRAGRPEPWMCLKCAHDLGVYPLEAIVKVGDTLPDIAEGLNAGTWTIGLAKTGNELGLNEQEIAALDRGDYQRRLDRAYARMHQAGAHYVVDAIGDLLPCLDDINARLKRCERP
jgi:phosphonoacetaldehyde hydrolase